METLKDILWPIALVGGVGGLIDFLIGRTGQERAKDFLLRWWVRFDDVHWKNFGREEGLFAGRLIKRWFGNRMYSLRRIIATLLSFGILILISYVMVKTLSKDPSVYWSFANKDIELWIDNRHAVILFRMESYYLTYLSILATYFVYLLAFCISVSLTAYLSVRISYLCGIGQGRNLIIFLAVLVLNCLILAFWYPIAEFNRLIVLTAINAFISWLCSVGVWTGYPGGHSVSLANEIYDVLVLAKNWLPGVSFFANPMSYLLGPPNFRPPIDSFSLHCLSLFPSIIRLTLSIVFVGSFLLRPVLMRPISLVWARIVESDRPVFTLTFGGAAAFATAMSEAVKHL